jgi:hypothetical protein
MNNSDISKESDCRYQRCGFLHPDMEAMTLEYCTSLGFDPAREPAALRVVHQRLACNLPRGWEVNRTTAASAHGAGILFFVDIASGSSQWEHPLEDEYIEEVARALNYPPFKNSRVGNVWDILSQVRLFLENQPSNETRPTITDKFSLKSAPSFRGVVVNITDAFPQISVELVQVFSAYFGVPSSNENWFLLAAAALCPVPMGWRYKLYDGIPYFSNVDGTISLRHPLDPFFKYAIKSQTSFDSITLKSSIALTASQPNPTWFDWSKMSRVTEEEALGQAYILLEKFSLDDSFQAIPPLFLEKLIEDSGPIILTENQISEIKVALIRIGTVVRFKRFYEIIGDLSQSCRMENKVKVELRNLLQSTSNELERTQADLLLTFTDLIGTGAAFNNPHVCSRICMRLLDVSDMVRSSSIQQKCTRVVCKYLEVFVLHEMSSEDELGVIERMEKALHLFDSSGTDNTVRRLLRILRVFTAEYDAPTIPDHISWELLIDDADDSAPEQRNADSANFMELVKLYIPGSTLFNRGVLSQFPPLELRKISLIMTQLIEVLNLYLLESLLARDRIISEVETKRESIRIMQE